RDGRRFDVERYAEPLEIAAELRHVVAIDEIVGVAVQQVDGRPRQHEGDVVFSGDDAHADAHRLERTPGRARVLGDEDEYGLVGHYARLSSARRNARSR